MLAKHRDAREAANVCKVDVLKDLELGKLIDAADNSEDCSKAAAEIFQQRFTKHVYKIVKNMDYTNRKTSILINSEEVSIYGLKYAMKLAKHFGHLIRKLIMKINLDKSSCSSIGANETIEFFKAVNEHCRKALVQFTLRYDACGVNNVFNQIINMFARVEVLTLDVHNMTQQAKKRKLVEMFPNVKHLQMKFHQLKDFAFVECKLPKLETLIIDDGSNEFNEQMFIDLLKNNPQITKLALVNHATPEVLGDVETYLPNLQSLVLDVQDEIDAKQNDSYTTFMLKFPNIQTLTIGNGLTNAQLLNLIGKYPKLSRASFSIDPDVKAENIQQFIEDSPSLNDFTVFGVNNSANICAIDKQLKKAIVKEFNVSFIGKEVQIKRKDPATIPSAAYTHTHYNAICNYFVMLIIAISTCSIFL